MVRLTMEEALRLGRERPQELQRRALAEREEFVFAVRDMRASYGQEWGGELRVLINGNVVLHLLPAFNEHMRDEDELPQFCVMPRGTSSAGDRVHTYDGGEELGAFQGVIFYVEDEQYRTMVAELRRIAEAGFDEHAWLPDTLVATSAFARFVSSRVLEHAVVRNEAPFDFRKLNF